MWMMQKLKTRVIKRDVNPEWNEDLTLSVQDLDTPVKIVSFCHFFCQIQDKDLRTSSDILSK